MRKDQREALQRLQDALLEEDFSENEPVPGFACNIYNTDSTDVDLEDYSEEVHRGRRRSSLPVLVFLICVAILGIMILWCLTVLGVLPWA